MYTPLHNFLRRFCYFRWFFVEAFTEYVELKIIAACSAFFHTHIATVCSDTKWENCVVVSLLLLFHTFSYWTIFNTFAIHVDVQIQEGCSAIFFLRITFFFDLVCFTLKSNEIRIKCKMSIVKNNFKLDFIAICNLFLFYTRIQCKYVRNTLFCL